MDTVSSIFRILGEREGGRRREGREGSGGEGGRKVANGGASAEREREMER